MPVTTDWSGISDKVSSWMVAYTEGRHTFGADVDTGERIVFGDHVRIGGNANVAAITTDWS